ncbi:FAD-dependent oxidoreductase [Streptomyces sp. NPDC048603]|uniref:FAD-dependent oxidoreductase n=1 Tax=Streptomyces sp. NPDC048603 TaxID=3365577 RepID=UPI003712B03F
MTGPVGDRAVVVGGSISGTLAARVLSDFYREVIVVERDQVVGVRHLRRGTPHAGHAHGLHSRGCLILEELFPGILDELRRAQFPMGDLGEQHWYFNGKRFRPARTGLPTVTTQRPVLEEYVRSKVAAQSGVTFLERTELVGLESTTCGARVTGVRLRSTAADTTGEYSLGADLVIDTCGRGSRTPVWLEQLGYERPPEERMAIGLAYVTRLYRSPKPLNGAQFLTCLASRTNPRGAVFGRAGDDDTYYLSLTGILGDHPPTDPDGYLQFCRSLPVADVYERIRDATPLTDPIAFRIPASVRRRYERLPRLPERLLVLGDAVCSLNPSYSQGMTVAAMEVMALRTHLRRGTNPSAPAFMRDVGKIINRPWFLSTTRDVQYTGGKGLRTLTARLGNAYVTRLHGAAQHDSAATDALIRVAGLSDPPTTLIRPRVVLAALKRQGFRDLSSQAPQ